MAYIYPALDQVKFETQASLSYIPNPQGMYSPVADFQLRLPTSIPECGIAFVLSHR